MKRQVCSYDMVAVPSHSYTLTDGEGTFTSNPRCLCIWAVLLVTKPNLPEGVRERSFILTGPSGTRRGFDNLVEFACCFSTRLPAVVLPMRSLSFFALGD